MSITSNHDFVIAMMKGLTFTGEPHGICTCYSNPSNPSLGTFYYYERKGFYTLCIGDYTIPNDFTLEFNNPNRVLRFGVVYQGETSFQLNDHDVSSFTPSSFFVYEHNIKGTQTWKKGQHFHGIEITLYEEYFTRFIKETYPDTLPIDQFEINKTLLYLPVDLVTILLSLSSLHQENKLNALYLDCKMLECIAVLDHEFKKNERIFLGQENPLEIMIGNSKKLTLSAQDLSAIAKAHSILTTSYCRPPTITALSREVLLSEQKLKAGFYAKYHMTIGEYTNSLRMIYAATLLSSTDLTIDEIAAQTGYQHSTNFGAAFRRHYNKTPLQYRKGN